MKLSDKNKIALDLGCADGYFTLLVAPYFKKITAIKTVFAKDYFCDEYYATYKDLDIFLQGVPIFEDFDSEKDRGLLEKYVEQYKTEKGIKLPRHRVVIVFQKP